MGKSLAKSIGKMEVALGAIADAVVFLDKAAKIEWCNPAFTRLVGRSHAAIIGEDFPNLLPLKRGGIPVSGEFYPDTMMRNGGYEPTEYEFSQNDKVLILEISVNCTADRSVVLVIRDVTLTKYTTENLIKNNQDREEYLSLLRATLESTADGILVVGKDCNVPVYNQKFLQMWRMPESLVAPGTGEERLKFLAEQTIDPEGFIARVWDLFLHHPEEVVLDLVELKDGRIFERYSQPQWSGDRIIGRVWSFRDISEQKRTEKRLRFAQFALDSISDNVAYCDRNARIHYVNQSSCRLLGYTREQLIGMTVQDVDPNYPIETWPDHWQELKEKGCIKFETTMLSREGNLIPVEVTANYLAFDDFEYDFSFSRDISERKKAEAALRRSELKFRNLFENSQVGIFRTRVEDGLILDANQRYIELAGYSSSEEVIGKRYSTEFYVNLSERQHILNEILQFGEINNLEMQFRRRDGAIRWGLYSIRLNQEDNCLEGVITDISDRKLAAEALQKSELKYRNIFQNSLVGIGRSRLEDGLFLDANQPCAEIIGYSSADELIGKRYAPEFQVDPNTRPMMLVELEKHGEVRNYEIQLRRLDGEISWGLFSARINKEESCLEFIIVDISDRKRLEEELRQSQQFLNSIINNIPLALFVKDIKNDFRYVLLNNVSEKFLGFSRERAIGLSDRDLISSEQADYYLNQDLTAVEKGIVEVPELGITNDRESILARVIKLPLFDDRENPTHLLCIAEDITERKHREQALRLIVEGTAAKTGSDFFFSCVRYLASVLRVRYAVVTEFADETKTKVRTLAFWQGEMFGENIEYNLPGTPYENLLIGKICYHSEGIQKLFPEDRYLGEMGVESYLGIPLIDSSGEILGHLAVLDVKPMENDPGRELILKIFAARAGAELERKIAEEALERRARVESLLSGISRAFIDRDENTALRFTLEAIACFLDAERCCIFELVDDPEQVNIVSEWCAPGIQPLISGLRESDSTLFPWFYQQIVNGQIISISSVAELPKEAGAEKEIFESQSIQSLLSVPMIHSEKVVGFIGADVVNFSKNWSQEDVNLLKLVGEIIAIGRARHQAEKALIVAKEAAIREAARSADANRAKSIFLANMSHELRTPLNAILGFAQLMERDPALTSRQKESLAIINRSGEHLLALINDVLEMSKIEAGRIVLHPAPFDLHRLLGTIREMFLMRTQTKQLSLEFDIAPDLPKYVFTDEGKLRQVLINLLGNAVKFTETGGVTLQASLVSIDSSEQMTISFAVRDTGKGIAPEELTNLFQAFVQTSSGMQAKEGTGLGLAISREFVRLMGGDIRVNSTLGEGSTFSFEVQVRLADVSEIAPSASNKRVLKVAPGQPIYRILVVDDRWENRDFMAQLLNTVGFETRTAKNGQEAIALWETWHPHLIWMDMRMPILDGYEATRQIRERYSNSSSPKIIALTASAFEEQRANILAAGCDDLVRKPFREQLIFEKMTEHLGVHYIYEEKPKDWATDEQARPKAGETIKPSDLAVMPAEWIAELNQASIEADGDRILQLIEQIPASHRILVQELTELVRNFCFDEILELTQEMI